MATMMRNAVYFLRSKMIESALGVGTTVILARKLSFEFFAVLGVQEMLLGFVNSLNGLGLVATIQRRLPNLLKKGDLPRIQVYIGYVLKTYFLMGLALSAIVFIMSELIAQLFLKDTSFTPYIIIISFHVFCVTMRNPLLLLCYVMKKIRQTTNVEIVTATISKSLSLGAFFIWSFGGYLIVPVIVYFLLDVYLVCVLMREKFFVLTIKKTMQSKFHLTFKQIVRHSFPYYALGIVNSAIVYGEHLMISLMLNVKYFGVYTFMKKFYMQIYYFFSSIANSAMYELLDVKNKNHKEKQKTFTKIAHIVFALFFSGAIFTSINSAFLVKIVGGGAYNDYNWILSLLMVQLIFCILWNIYATAVYSFLSPITSFLNKVVPGVAMIVLSAVSIKLFGQHGIVWGGLLSYTIGFFISYFFLKKKGIMVSFIDMLTPLVLMLLGSAVILWGALYFNEIITLINSIAFFMMFFVYLLQVDKNRKIYRTMIPYKWRSAIWNK